MPKFLGCAKCVDEGKPEAETEGSPRYSFGVYAGRYCDKHWKTSGYRDATDPDARFDPADAGESLEPEDEFALDDRDGDH